MSILFVGSEDISFAYRNNPTFGTTGGSYRSSYARGAVGLQEQTNLAYAGDYLSTPVTSCWFSGQYYFNINITADRIWMGLTDGGAPNDLARVRLGLRVSATNKFVLVKYDGATATVLGTGTLSVSSGQLYRIDVEVVNYNSASGRCRVYVNRSATADIDSGLVDLRAGGSTNLSGIFLRGQSSTGSAPLYLSEVVVADEDTRMLDVVTLYPNAAGDLNEFTGAYTDVDESANNDGDVISSSVADQTFLSNLLNLPSTSVRVLAVAVHVRAWRDASTPQKVALGVKTNSVVSLGADQTLLLTGAEYKYQTNLNPITGVEFTATEVNALQ